MPLMPINVPSSIFINYMKIIMLRHRRPDEFLAYHKIAVPDGQAQPYDEA